MSLFFVIPVKTFLKFDPDFPIIKAEQGFEHPICGVAFEQRVGVSPCLSPPPHCSLLKFDPDFPIIKAEQGFEHPVCGVDFGLRVGVSPCLSPPPHCSLSSLVRSAMVELAKIVYTYAWDIMFM